MRISDWSSDVCSSDLSTSLLSQPWLLISSSSNPPPRYRRTFDRCGNGRPRPACRIGRPLHATRAINFACRKQLSVRSEEHTSELQSLMRISYAAFCLQYKKQHISIQQTDCNSCERPSASLTSTH